jgi:DegT/DnrJ/EryC1/StrS aminotransferase family
MIGERMPIRIPVYKPDLSGNERAYVNECLESGWISSKGKFVSVFEQAFSGYLGVDFAIGVCNGTTALHLALLALGLGGDEVIVPTLTYIAANTVTYTGALPVFIDIGRWIPPMSSKRSRHARAQSWSCISMPSLQYGRDFRDREKTRAVRHRGCGGGFWKPV